jgi:Uma2 family endonuclease
MATAATPYTVVLDPKAYEGIHLLETDGEPMDSFWHFDCMCLLIDVANCYCRAKSDYIVGGNNFIYFNPDQARNLDYRGPDFFYIKSGVDRTRERRYWAVWEESGRLPDVIIELVSPTTEREDRTTKFVIYEQTLRTPEYFLYDPDTQVLEGWRLRGDRFQALTPNERGWLWSEELGLWVGTWYGSYFNTTGTLLRFYDAQGNLVPTHEELQAQRAEAERQRAEAERQRAEAERQRALAAEAELARVKALLAQQTQITKPNGGKA